MIAMNQKGNGSQSQQANESFDLQNESLQATQKLKFSGGFRRRARSGESLEGYLPPEAGVNTPVPNQPLAASSNSP